MPLALITYNKNIHNRNMSGKKDTTILKGSKICLKKIALVQNCTTGVEDKMLSTLASPRCDVKYQLYHTMLLESSGLIVSLYSVQTGEGIGSTCTAGGL